MFNSAEDLLHISAIHSLLLSKLQGIVHIKILSTCKYYIELLQHTVMEIQRDINALIIACRNEELGTVKEIMEGAEIDVNAIAEYRYPCNLLKGISR